MQREERASEAALEALVSRVADLKATIGALLLKLEHDYETINWPTMLDNFALLSGQVNMLLKILKNDKTPNLRNLIVLPIRLCPDRDEELAKLTEKRITVFNHEVVPDYLRTKPDPDVEQREQQIVQRSNLIVPDAGQKQINSINKIVNQTLELISSTREQWESEAGSRASATQTSSMADTHHLISAVCLGKSLKSSPMKMPTTMPTTVQGGPPTNQMMATSTGGGGGAGQPMGKGPSSIKTNIKSAASMHPYAR